MPLLGFAIVVAFVLVVLTVPLVALMVIPRICPDCHKLVSHGSPSCPRCGHAALGLTLAGATGDAVPDTGLAPSLAGATGDFVVGTIAVVAGILVSLGTYLAAEPGGYFWVFFGPVVYGLYRVGRGLVRLSGGEGQQDG